MKVAVEDPDESKDFGDETTIKIMAFEPHEIFRLGVIFTECIAAGLEVVHGETDDQTGKFLRLPLVAGLRRIPKA